MARDLVQHRKPEKPACITLEAASLATQIPLFAMGWCASQAFAYFALLASIHFGFGWNLGYENQYGMDLLTRTARNAEGTHENCCGKGKNQFTEEEKKNFADCIKKYEGFHADRADIGENVGLLQMHCVTQCLAAKNNIIDDAGYVKVKAFDADMQQIYPEDSVKKVASSYAQKCTDIANNLAKKDWEPHKNDTCNPAACIAAHCLMNRVDLYCPEDLKSNSEVCKHRRDHIEQTLKLDGEQK